MKRNKYNEWDQEDRYQSKNPKAVLKSKEAQIKHRQRYYYEQQSEDVEETYDIYDETYCHSN